MTEVNEALLVTQTFPCYVLSIKPSLLHRQTGLVSWSHHSLLICRYFKHPPDPLADCSAWFLQSTQLISWFLVPLLLQKFLVSPEHLTLPRRSSTYWNLSPVLQPKKKSNFRVREDSCLQKANCLSLKPTANWAEPTIPGCYSSPLPRTSIWLAQPFKISCDESHQKVSLEINPLMTEFGSRWTRWNRGVGGEKREGKKSKGFSILQFSLERLWHEQKQIKSKRLEKWLLPAVCPASFPSGVPVYVTQTAWLKQQLLNHWKFHTDLGFLSYVKCNLQLLSSCSAGA